MIKRLILLTILSVQVAYAQKATKLSQPEKDFETFWTAFNDNYAFFKLKGIDWNATYQTYRPTINAHTKEKQLFDIFGKMVDPLKDGHITISKGDEIVYKSRKPSDFKTQFAGKEKEFWQLVNQTLIKQGFGTWQGVGPVFKEENLYYFSTSKETSYIRISRCFGEMESLFDEQKEKEDTQLMLSLFDDLLQKSSDKSTLIIDIRANGGGHGGFNLASKLISAPITTHYLSVKSKDGFSEPKAQVLENAAQNYRFKKIILLTNDKTASSAEDFTISLYQQPNVTTIGTNTSGMLSDMFEAKLNQEVSFTLSNQAYFSLDKQLLEDQGVPVKIRVSNTIADIKAGEDPVLLKAIQVSSIKNAN